jgi:predicted ATPase
MIQALEIDNYRSLRRFSLRCGKLVVITGGNGVGKTNLYRGLCLLSRWAIAVRLRWKPLRLRGLGGCSVRVAEKRRK